VLDVERLGVIKTDKGLAAVPASPILNKHITYYTCNGFSLVRHTFYRFLI
jgi:hypothetical protein